MTYVQQLTRDSCTVPGRLVLHTDALSQDGEALVCALDVAPHLANGMCRGSYYYITYLLLLLSYYVVMINTFYFIIISMCRQVAGIAVFFHVFVRVPSNGSCARYGRGGRTYIYTYTYIYIYIYTHLSIYLSLSIYICMCICVYIYI